MQPPMHFPASVTIASLPKLSVTEVNLNMHVFNAFYVYLQAKIGKEEILKLTIQYIRRQKGKYRFYC